jgi:hypothetical protein
MAAGRAAVPERARGKRWTRNAIAHHVIPPALEEANRQRARAGPPPIRDEVTPHTPRYTCIGLAFRRGRRSRVRCPPAGFAGDLSSFCDYACVRIFPDFAAVSPAKRPTAWVVGLFATRGGTRHPDARGQPHPCTGRCPSRGSNLSGRAVKLDPLHEQQVAGFYCGARKYPTARSHSFGRLSRGLVQLRPAAATRCRSHCVVARAAHPGPRRGERTQPASCSGKRRAEQEGRLRSVELPSDHRQLVEVFRVRHKRKRVPVRRAAREHIDEAEGRSSAQR